VIAVEAAVDPKLDVPRTQTLADFGAKLLEEQIDPPRLFRRYRFIVEVSVANENVVVARGNVSHDKPAPPEVAQTPRRRNARSCTA
jgi:hypothetical protein